MAEDDEILDRAKHLVSGKLGLVVPGHQEARLLSAIDAVSALHGMDGRALLVRLEVATTDSAVWQAVAARIVVGETCFFRHRAWFDTLVESVLQPLIRTRRSQGQHYLRVWSAGCSTGEEPYSLAIALSRLLPDMESWTVSILGTDVNPDALSTARNGVYKPWAMREVSPAERRAGFSKLADGAARIRPEIARIVRFAQLNLVDEAWDPRSLSALSMDVILCRNVLMYFAAEVQLKVVNRLTECLAPKGWLGTSPVEASPELLAPLIPVTFPHGIFFCRTDEGGGPSRGPGPSPLLPYGEEFGGESIAGVPENVSAAVAVEAEAALSGAVHLPTLDEARSLADAGMLGEARDRCRTILAADPHCVDALLLLAAVCAEQDDHAAAMDTVRRAIFIDPEAIGAVFLEAMFLLRCGDVARAKRRMRQFLDRSEDLAPDTPLSIGNEQTVSAARGAAQEFLRLGDTRGGEVSNHAIH